MKPNDDDLTRWLDGELDPGAASALDAEAGRDPALAAERTGAAGLGALLRQAYPLAQDVSGPELFMHQLARRLDGATPAVVAPPAGPAWRRWLAPMAAAAAVVAIGFVFSGHPHPEGGTAAPNALLSSYAPDPGVKVDARYVEEADAVVIVLDGLAPVTEPDDILGFSAHDPRPVVARLGGAGKGPGPNLRHRFGQHNDG